MTTAADPQSATPTPQASPAAGGDSGLREKSHRYLDEIVEAAHAEFGKTNPGKVEQLSSHVATVKMVVDDLHDTAPPTA